MSSLKPDGRAAPSASASGPAPDRARGDRPARFDPRVYLDPRPRPWLIRAIGPINRVLILPRLLKLRRFDLPAADEARLRAAVNPATAAFIGPGHPEFMTDWMIDKELSRRVSPLMAHWAAYEIVNISPLAQRFWLANNLIAAAPGGGGKEYSVRWALAGHGVLLHPEGSVSWHGDHINRLIGGIADMAIETCRQLAERGERRAVWMVPAVWRLCFEHDVGAPLGREMAHIERTLGLPRGDGLSLEQRFAALQISLLRRGAERLEIAAPHLAGELAPRDYFAAQDEVAWALRRRLSERHDLDEPDLDRLLHGLRRSLRARADSDPDGTRRDRAMLTELTRLSGFPRERYSGETLAQEHISENLKRTRALLLTRGWRETLHNLVPVAVAPRSAHVRVAEPIAVHDAYAAHGGDDPDELRERLLDTHRSRLQQTLDGLNASLAPTMDRYRRPNPMESAPHPVAPHAPLG